MKGSITKKIAKLIAIFFLVAIAMPAIANDFSSNVVLCSGHCGGCNKPCGGQGNGDGDCDNGTKLTQSSIVMCSGHCGGCNKPCGGHGNGGCGGDKDDNADN